MTDFDNRIKAAKRNLDSKLALEIGVAADAKWNLAIKKGTAVGLEFNRIIQLCDVLQSYELRAEQYAKARKEAGELAQFIARHGEEVLPNDKLKGKSKRSSSRKHENTQATVIRENTKKWMKLVKENLDEANAAIGHDMRWFKELLDLLVRNKLTAMLMSCDESRKRKSWPHELKSFDWPQFGHDLLAVRDEIHYRMVAVDSSPPKTTDLPTPKTRGRKQKFDDPDEALILHTYKSVGTQKGTVEKLKLESKGGLSPLKRVGRIVARYRTRKSRNKKQA